MKTENFHGPDDKNTIYLLKQKNFLKWNFSLISSDFVYTGFIQGKMIQLIIL